MKKFFPAIFFMFFALHIYANGVDGVNGVIGQDTDAVIQLTKQAYEARLTNAQQTVNTGDKALELATKLNYNSGIAEAYRVKGIGQYYMNDPEAAINSYINALTFFKKANNKKGEAKVYNNIGNLYRDNNYGASLEYFQKALDIGHEIADNALVATAYLNLGNLYSREKSYNQALKYYKESEVIFNVLHDSVNLIQCAQNRGVAYFSLNQLEMAEQLLTSANKRAKERDLNETVASIDLTLALVYIKENKFEIASKIVAEGLAYSHIINDDKLERDFEYTSYQLEFKRGNYERAVHYLSDVYLLDSALQKTMLYAQINIYEIKHKQEQQEQQNIINDQTIKYERAQFWGAIIAACLLLIVIGLLISNVKRKAKTNAQLTELNEEVSRQKDNLDRVNHHLEEIIDERTKDLQLKNKKLSEYSSYLSHQIRGPIATLKGLMNLEKEGLVDKQECIVMMDKCVSEIDEKIIEMSDMMHDPGK
ncbi:Tetratricopeptide repeat-containing protein [Mucilaginibacter mallensis]|uniref:Tetratricopeptide repeat-containing protein n=1 Tax=Mucilaginibacter mallensis TaxID=652787 RepID=A0A1H1Z3N2_MUCMA|nr:tetratricopeptide repeat protein [Mucilaginibacter mallensis]SDT28223.1 Tetratricopeptide repeat-containing protein [Mucilaginibacter mallensis]